VKRSRLEITRAALRLDGETLVPIECLREKTTASSRALIRWITAGRAGVFLDGIHKPGIGWVSSFAALERFFREMIASARESDDPELARLRKDSTA
jgi:hypothetical protein